MPSGKSDIHSTKTYNDIPKSGSWKTSTRNVRASTSRYYRGIGNERQCSCMADLVSCWTEHGFVLRPRLVGVLDRDETHKTSKLNT